MKDDPKIYFIRCQGRKEEEEDHKIGKHTWEEEVLKYKTRKIEKTVEIEDQKSSEKKVKKNKRSVG